MAVESGYVRIGELARRVGVRRELLRAWETRYGLLSPSRSAGGFRLYSDEDERRVRAMQAQIARGLSAAEAARLALEAEAGTDEVEPATAGVERLQRAREELREALDAFDDARANRAFDSLLAAFSTEAVLREVVLPYLAELGARWSRGEASVAQEHFASNVLRGRLLGLARGWGQGTGPRALLACAPGELHDLPLLVFGLALRARGWRVTFLGADTPVPTLAEAAATLRPEIIVVSAVSVEPIAAAAGHLAALDGPWTLAVGGPGARASEVAALGALPLHEGPLEEAEWLTGRT